jgi:agmatinase
MLDKDFWLPHNFAALPKESSDFARSRVTILPVPYEQTTSYKHGTGGGPAAIISASRNLELYDEELECEPYRLGICTLDELEPVLGDGRRMVERIAEVAEWLVAEDKLPVALGGEHTLSLGLVKALASRYQDLSVLALDAHADLRDSYQGSKYSHACTLRRINELSPVVPVGIRSLSREEADWARNQGLKIFWAQDIMADANWQAEVVKHLSTEVYITIDLDVFDPAIMPAVGTPEPGGLGWYPVLQLLKRVAGERQVVGADVVELSPLPANVAPDFTAAKLVYKLLGYIFKGSSR